MSRLGAFVMTFRRPQALRETLAALLAQSRPPQAVLVVDNAPDEAARAVVRAFAGSGVQHAPMGDNVGPAGAAAHGLAWGLEEGFDWIYWGDDDDPPKTADTLERLLRLGEEGGERVGAMGAAGTRWDWRRGRNVRLPDEALRGALEVDVVAGSSQLVLRSAAVREVGLPEARLFFGFEEGEYCLRLRRAGWRILIEGELLHEYRRQAGRLGLASATPVRPRHDRRDLWRRYYSTRNYVWVMRQTFGRPDLARREAAKALLRCVTAWGRGPRYGAAFNRLQLAALRDGYRGRLGRTVEPPPAGTAPPSPPPPARG